MAEGGLHDLQDFEEMLDVLHDMEEDEFYEEYSRDPVDEEDGAEMMEVAYGEDEPTANLVVEDDVHDVDDITDQEQDYLTPAAKREKRGRPFGWRKDKDEVPVFRPREKRKEKKEPMPVEDLISFVCCVSLCLASVSQAVVETARQNLALMSLMERSKWVLQWLRDHSRCVDGRTVTTYSIGGQTVCLKAWRAALHIPQSTFYAIMDRFNRGQVSVAGPGNVTGRMSSAAQEAMSWLYQFAADHADKLPDSTKLHLPSCLTKMSVYSMYLESSPGSLLSLSHFLRLWRETMTHIVIPRRSRFSQCDICTKIKNKLMEAKTKQEKKPLLEYRTTHLQIQNAERRKYYKHATKAKKEPGKYLSIIIDAMDQRKTSVPNFYTESKSLANTYRLRVNLMAVVAHGIGIYGFFDAFQWSHGASYTLSVLSHCFTMLESLPDTLYLQMDNCYGQNKNKYTLGFLARLVEEKIFKKVKLSFLLVGHTHEDVDQVFSRFSVWIGQNSILTMDELMRGFESCYTPRPTAMKTHQVFNFQRWLGVKNVKNHSKPHVFKITRNEDSGKAEILYKGLSTDKEWIRPAGDGLILDEQHRELYTIPPTTDNIDLEKLKSDLGTVYSYYNEEPLKQWWDNYMDELYEEEEQEMLEFNLIGNLQQKKLTSSSSPAGIEGPTVTNGIAGLPHLTPEIPTVIIGTAEKAQSSNTSQREVLRPGHFVLCTYDKYPDEFPQLAQVVSVGDTLLELLWYKGAKTSSWKAATRPVKGQRGQREPWKELVPLSAVWLQGFKLTPLGKLPQHIREQIDNFVQLA